LHSAEKKWKPLVTVNFNPPLPASKEEVVLKMEMPSSAKGGATEEKVDTKPTVVSLEVNQMIERGPVTMSDGRLGELLKHLEKKKIKFVDGSFDLTTQNLTKKEIEWLRPDKIWEPSEVSLFPKDTEEAEKDTKVAERVDIVQGLLGDCWLVTTMAILYTHNPFLLENLFKIWRPDLGLVVVQFYKEGQPVYVIVDDRLPAVGNRLAYCQHNEPGVLWGTLLEKAYAKMMGGYEKIEGGTIPYSLSDFTCHATFDVTVKKNQKAPPQFLKEWMSHSNLYERHDIEYLSGASIISKGHKGDDCIENGLCVNHAYAILNIVKDAPVAEDCSLVELRNPWGRDKWKGDWSAESKRWTGKKGEELQQKLNYDPKDTRGRIWMDLKAFLNNFNHIYYAPFFHSAITSNTIASAWTKANSGGCGNAGAVEWAKNPQYKFTKATAKNEGVLYVYLYQDDLLWRDPKLATYMKNRFHAIGIQIWKTKDGKRLSGPLADCQTGLTSGYGSKREQMVNLARLEPGDYVVVPTTFKQGLYTGFKIGIFSHDPSVKLTPLQDALKQLPKPTGLAQWREHGKQYSFETGELATSHEHQWSHAGLAGSTAPQAAAASKTAPKARPSAKKPTAKKSAAKATTKKAAKPAAKKKGTGPAKIVVSNKTGKQLEIRIVYKKGKAGGALPKKEKPVTLQCPPGAIALWWCMKGGNIKKPDGKIEFPHPLEAGEKHKIEVKK